MKKKIIYGVCLFLIVFLAPACEKTCKNCKKVYYTNQTTWDHEDPESEYCGVELAGIEAMGPRTVGNLTVKWECR